jgi:D-threo-aldose 1-dehydrogenase
VKRTSRQLGRTALRLPDFGFGSAPLGELYERIDESVAEATIEAAWNAGLRYFDTSPWYGRGLSELRLGHWLRNQPRTEFALSTKVGRTFHRPRKPVSFKPEFWAGGLSFDHRFDYTYDGIMRSYEQSTMRLGLNAIDVLFIHDLDVAELGSLDLVKQHFIDLERSGWRALETLRYHGEIAAIGAGVNILGTIPEFLKRFDLDCFLVAMPYTLLDQGPMESEFPLCIEHGASIIVGSPFASGILATGTQADKLFYNYAPAPPAIVEKTKRIETVCRTYEVSLKAAALQFPLRNSIVTSVISGPVTPAQATENARLLDIEIADCFWEELKAEHLLHPDA